MPKRVLDEFDLEAEREGYFVAKHNKTVCRPFGWGKTICKQRRMHLDGEKKIECKTIKERYSR
jgi:hypothetical protein